MRRFITLSVLGLAAIASLNAGMVTVGGSTGLNSAYVANGCSVAEGAAITTGCINGVTPTQFWRENAYSTVLFQGAQTLSTALPTQGATVTDANSVPFQILSGDTPSARMYWGASQDTGTGSGGLIGYITIPVEAYGVGQIWTMLNDYYPMGSNDASSTIVYFNFSPNGPTDTTGAGVIQVGVTLQNGVQIAPATCVGGSGSHAASGTALCTETISPSSSAAMTVNGVAAGNTTVTTSTVYSANYLSNNGGVSFNNTFGTLYLNDQGFNFGETYANDWLVSISVEDLNGPTDGNHLNNKSALSAITIATPEPSTVWLFGTGLALVGLAYRRRRSI